MLLGAVLLAVMPLITGADGEGCSSGDATAGGGEPGECVRGTGCADTICSDGPPQAATCVLTLEKECILWLGICERDEEGACGWRQSPEMLECLADERLPVSEPCVKNSYDGCSTDADCTIGGCGGDVCFNPAVSDGASDCDCEAPTYGCGCVRGACVWFE